MDEIIAIAQQLKELVAKKEAEIVEVQSMKNEVIKDGKELDVLSADLDRRESAVKEIESAQAVLAKSNAILIKAELKAQGVDEKLAEVENLIATKLKDAEVQLVESKAKCDTVKKEVVAIQAERKRLVEKEKNMMDDILKKLKG